MTDSVISLGKATFPLPIVKFVPLSAVIIDENIDLVVVEYDYVCRSCQAENHERFLPSDLQGAASHCGNHTSDLSINHEFLFLLVS